MKKVVSVFLFFLVTLSLNAINLDISCDSSLSVSSKIEKVTEAAFVKALKSRAEINETDSDILKINIEIEEFDNQNYSIFLKMKIEYNNKVLLLNPMVYLSSDIKFENDLENSIYNSIKYDLDYLFISPDVSLDFIDSSLVSFNFAEEEKPLFKVGGYYFGEDISKNKVALFSINSIYDNNAIVNVYYNSTLVPNLKIIKGPKYNLATNLSYSFSKKLGYFSLDLKFLELFSPFLKNIKPILSFTLSHNFTNSKFGGSIDCGLSLDFPLSILGNQDFVLNNTGINLNVLMGVEYSDNYNFHGSYRVGIYQYLNVISRIEIFYQNNSLFDSNDIFGLGFSLLY